MSFNKITVVGNLGRDPELRYTPQGTAVCDFSIATNEKRRDKSGEMQDITTWFRITTWGKVAENASKYLTKGKPVYVEGRMRIEEYTDRDGKARWSIEVNASDLQFLSGGGGGGEYGGSSDEGDDQSTNKFASETTANRAAPATEAPGDDDIPF